MGLSGLNLNERIHWYEIECGRLQTKANTLEQQLAELRGERERMIAALEYVWSVQVRENVHLGLERGSGVHSHNHCIACICAAGLGRGMDPVTDEGLRIHHEKYKAEFEMRQAVNEPESTGKE